MERVRVRLTRKLAEEIDGVDLSSRHVGDVFPLPAPEARLLLAEEWAVPAEKRESREPRDPTSDSR
jgi:hypothetical protein